MPFAGTFQYIPGEQNTVADVLSRFPQEADREGSGKML